jgi:hypothetical protein
MLGFDHGRLPDQFQNTVMNGHDKGSKGGRHILPVSSPAKTG